jgi:hypothetical protein
MMTRFDAAAFEAAIIRDGAAVHVGLRRCGPPILDHLTLAERRAVEIYAGAFEAVAAGGATMPRNSLVVGSSGGSRGASREGRQAHVLEQAAFLRHMAAAVRSRPDLVFGKRKPVTITALSIWHGFVVDGLHVKGMLTRCGVKDGRALAPATAALLSEVRAQAAAVLDALGKGRDPFGLT